MVISPFFWEGIHEGSDDNVGKLWNLDGGHTQKVMCLFDLMLELSTSNVVLCLQVGLFIYLFFLMFLVIERI